MQNETPRLHHEKLDVYVASINFLTLASKLIEKYPRGNSSIADQLKRASLSIPLNIAEGCGKKGADRSRFYDISRGSSHECGAILDASKVLGIIDDESYFEGKKLLYRIVSMLFKMSE